MKSSFLQKAIQKNRAKSHAKRRKSHKKRLRRYNTGYIKSSGSGRRGQGDFIKSYLTIKIPANFSLRHNTEQVLKKVAELDFALRQRRKIFINLKDITEITPGAILLLLSKMKKFQDQRIPFNGNFPRDIVVREKFTKSGFFNILYKYKFQSAAQIATDEVKDDFTHKGKKVYPELAGKFMSQAVAKVFGQNETNSGIYRILIEAMNNTFNHAAGKRQGGERWWIMSYHYEDRNVMSFVFLDNGIGILNSIKKNAVKDGIWDKLRKKFTDDVELLKAAFDGREKSSTGLPYRGKGLPAMQESLNRNFYSNLVVITNKQLIDFQKDVSRNLKVEFSGTFLYFELSIDNINR